MQAFPLPYCLIMEAFLSKRYDVFATRIKIKESQKQEFNKVVTEQDLRFNLHKVEKNPAKKKKHFSLQTHQNLGLLSRKSTYRKYCKDNYNSEGKMHDFDF